MNIYQTGIDLLVAGYGVYTLSFLKRNFGFESLKNRYGETTNSRKARILFGRIALALVLPGLALFAIGGLA